MSDLYGSDAYSPTEIAARVEQVGVAKARLPLLAMLMLSMLAGAFVGLGALYFVIVQSDPTLGFAVRQRAGRTGVLRDLSAQEEPGCASLRAWSTVAAVASR